MKVWAAIAEYAFDGTDVKLFKEKKGAVKQIHAWIGEDVCGLRSDYEKTGDEDLLNFCLEMVKSLSLIRDADKNVVWASEKDFDTTYFIKELEIE